MDCRIAAVNAPAEGYTLLLVAANNAISATLYEKLNFNLIRDIAPVASIIRVPNVLQVHPSVPAKTVPDIIAYAKANPGKINFASSGVQTIRQIPTPEKQTLAGRAPRICRWHRAQTRC